MSVRTATRLWRLLIFGFYLMLWSKLFRRSRLITPLEAALLGTKSVHHPPPELEVSGGSGQMESWSRGFSAVNAALFLNLKNPDVLSTARYAQPAPSFRAIYLWDSAFIAQIWKIWDPEVAWDVLRSVVALRKGDRLQHYVSDLASSKFTPPPLLAWSFVQLQAVVGCERFKSWAQLLYEPLRAYHHWLYAHRQLPNGLFAWAHPYESRVENAPRFSSRDERQLKDTRRFAAPDFCAYMVLQCDACENLPKRDPCYFARNSMIIKGHSSLAWGPNRRRSGPHLQLDYRNSSITCGFLSRGPSFDAETHAETKHAYPGGVATSSYQLVINNTAVDLGDSKTPATRPCFKNTLSAGDRTTLALAFFLASLDRDPAIAEKLVVFDDPFNSQDAFRRRQTVHEIMRMAGRRRQSAR